MNTLIHCPGQQVCVHMCLHRYLHTQTRNYHGTSHATICRVLSAFPILIAIFRQFSNSIKNSFLCGTRYDTRSQQESTSQSFFKEEKKKGGIMSWSFQSFQRAGWRSRVLDRGSCLPCRDCHTVTMEELVFTAVI